MAKILEIVKPDDFLYLWRTKGQPELFYSFDTREEVFETYSKTIQRYIVTIKLFFISGDEIYVHTPRNEYAVEDKSKIDEAKRSIYRDLRNDQWFGDLCENMIEVRSLPT